MKSIIKAMGICGLLLCCGCRSVSEGGGAAVGVKPAFGGRTALLPPGPLFSKREDGTVLCAYLDFLDRICAEAEEGLSDKEILARSREVLNKNILPAGEEKRAEYVKLRILSDHHRFMLESAEALSADIREAADMEKALVKGRLLNAVRSGLTGLESQIVWEEEHSDWAGSAWTGLFRGEIPVCRLPDLWMARSGDGVEMDLEAWRKAPSVPLNITENWKNQLPEKSDGQLSLLQELAAPKDGKGKCSLKFRAFSGRCTIHVNGTEKYRKKNSRPESFSVPLGEPENDSWVIVICFPDGPSPGSGKWPVWLGAE